MIELPIRRQVIFDLKATPHAMVLRVDGAEVYAQVYPGDALNVGAPTLAVVPAAQESALEAALAAGGLAPGSGETGIGAVFEQYDGFAVLLPLDRRIVSVRVPFPASVFVYDSTAAGPPVSGLVWTRELARSCGCSGGPR